MESIAAALPFPEIQNKPAEAGAVYQNFYNNGTQSVATPSGPSRSSSFSVPPSTQFQTQCKNEISWWRRIVAEFLGTLIFIFLATGTVASGVAVSSPEPAVAYLMTALAFGLSLATAIYITAHISGGLLNPAVTLALTLVGNTPVWLAICFVIAELCGAMAAAGLVLALFGNKSALGVTLLGANTSIVQGFFVEVILTFILCMVVLEVGVNKRSFAVTTTYDPLGRSPLAPLIIGLALIPIHLVGMSRTGCGINPARAFGPAVVADSWSDHWIYWVGPIVGAVFAAGVARSHVFKTLKEIVCVSVDYKSPTAQAPSIQGPYLASSATGEC